MLKKLITSLVAVVMMASLSVGVMANDIPDMGRRLSSAEAVSVIDKLLESDPNFLIDMARDSHVRNHSDIPFDPTTPIEVIVYVGEPTDQGQPAEPRPEPIDIMPRYYACPNPTGHDHVSIPATIHKPCEVDNCGKCDVYTATLYQCRYCTDAYKGPLLFSYTHNH